MGVGVCVWGWLVKMSVCGGARDASEPAALVGPWGVVRFILVVMGSGLLLITNPRPAGNRCAVTTLGWNPDGCCLPGWRNPINFCRCTGRAKACDACSRPQQLRSRSKDVKDGDIKPTRADTGTASFRYMICDVEFCVVLLCTHSGMRGLFNGLDIRSSEESR